jgi:hypothetical protein
MMPPGGDQLGFCVLYGLAVGCMGAMINADHDALPCLGRCGCLFQSVVHIFQ